MPMPHQQYNANLQIHPQKAMLFSKNTPLFKIKNENAHPWSWHLQQSLGRARLGMHDKAAQSFAAATAVTSKSVHENSDSNPQPLLVKMKSIK